VSARRLAENEQMVAHTHEIIGELEALLSTLKDAETGQRGYLLTQDEKYLQPYEDALQKVQPRFDRIKELTSDNPDQQARLAVLGPKINLRLDELRQTVALVKKGDRPAAMKVARSDAGKATMDDLREWVAAMRQAEEELLRERSQGGLGIGLTLVKRLVDMHGGTVTAHSEGPGKGSEFIVRLPALSERPRHDAPGPAAEPAAPSRRVLVVDDNPDTASSLAMLLRMTGNETHTAHDGLEAVGAARTFRPDVVLLDVGLPRLNGLDACRRIREQPWGKDMVIVAVTGWGQDDDRRKTEEAGFDGHLVKPVDHAALMKLLAEKQPESA
jgi:CHASE3 domain sensor protein/CheY-like chemotaxis protein